MSSRRDYEPSREPGARERMAEGADLKEGLAGRMTAKKDGAYYRTYREKGQERPEKKWGGMFDE